MENNKFGVRRPAELKRLKPEMVISKSVVLKADVKIHTLLRIEGRLDGRVISPPDGALILCNGGQFIGDLSGLGIVYLDGTVTGDVCVNHLGLGPHAVIEGKVTCRRFEVAAGAVVNGPVQVGPQVDVSAHNAVGSASPLVKEESFSVV